MNNESRVPRILLVLAAGFAAAALPSPEARADSYNKPAASCSGLVLQAAQGLPSGKDHGYSFKGTCKVWIQQVSGGKVELEHSFVTLWAEAAAKWDGSANTLKEKVKLTNPAGPAYSGEVSTVLKCAQDPIVDPPNCVLVAHQNTTGWDAFDEAPVHARRPILAGKTTLAEAAQKSNDKAASPVPPPPAPSPQPTSLGKPASRSAGPARTLSRPASGAERAQGRASALEVEAEDLVSNGHATTAGGQVVIQPMSDFGTGWSHDAQLFWHGGAVGAVLDLMVDVPTSGTYAVTLWATHAPDFGDLALAVNGLSSSAKVVGYAPAVTAPVAVEGGKFSLQKGQNTISLMIVGKQAASSGYLAGIDRLRLLAVSAP